MVTCSTRQQTGADVEDADVEDADVEDADVEDADGDLAHLTG